MEVYVCKCGHDKWTIRYGGIQCASCGTIYEIRLMSPVKFEREKDGLERIHSNNS